MGNTPYVAAGTIHLFQARRGLDHFQVFFKNTFDGNFPAISLLLLLVVGLDVATGNTDVACVHSRSEPVQHVSHATHGSSPRTASHLKLHKLSPNDSGVSAMLRNMRVLAPSPPKLHGRHERGTHATRPLCYTPVLQQVRQLAVPERNVLLLGGQRVDDVGQ